MRTWKVKLLAWGMAVLASGLLSTGTADAADYPKLTGRVVDEAGILSESSKRDLNNELHKHEEEIGDQVVVVTVRTLSGRTIESFGRNLGNHWRLGRGNGDRAVILIIAPNERHVRIEVARGLASVLTDEIANEILERDILPNFRSGDYEQCIRSGTAAILHELEQGRVESSDDNSALETGLVLFVVIGIFIVLIAMVRSDGFKKNKNRPEQDGFDGSYQDFTMDYSGGGGSFDGGGASGGDGH